MKFSVLRENFSRGLSIAAHIASRNVNLPILHNILLDVQNEGITLITTNLEMSIRVRVRGKAESLGAFTVPAQVLTNYILLLSEERLDVEKKQNELLLSAGIQQTKIKGEEASEFPLIPDVPKEHPLRMMSEHFRRALEPVLSAVSHDDSRPELTGVYFQVKDNHLLLAATDSYRLAESRIPLLEEQQAQQEAGRTSFIIPSATLFELVRILPSENNNTKEIHLFMSDSQAVFVMTDIELSSRIIEGTFPDYQQIIPQKFQTTITMKREETIRAIKAAGLFSRAGIHDINLHFSPEQNITTITTVNTQLGENTTKIPCSIEGEPNMIVFNYRYLLDALTSITGEDFFLLVVDNISPGVFRPTQKEEQISFLYIIMPIKQ